MKKIGKKKALEILERLKEAHPNAKGELNAENPYQLLIATILSAQTTDIQVNKVTGKLFKDFPTAGDLGRADPETIEGYIRSIGFFRTKAKNIVRTGAILDEEYGGRVPDKMEELIKLPGVGRKTANVVLSNAFDTPAIAVDTHVFRVSNRLGLSKSDNVEDCEKDLRALLPRDQWSHAHHLLIFQGRYVCKARKPECQNCNLRDYCLYFKESGQSI